MAFRRSLETVSLLGRPCAIDCELPGRPGRPEGLRTEGVCPLGHFVSLAPGVQHDVVMHVWSVTAQLAALCEATLGNARMINGLAGVMFTLGVL